MRSAAIGGCSVEQVWQKRVKYVSLEGQSGAIRFLFFSQSVLRVLRGFVPEHPDSAGRCERQTSVSVFKRIETSFFLVIA